MSEPRFVMFLIFIKTEENSIKYIDIVWLMFSGMFLDFNGRRPSKYLNTATSRQLVRLLIISLFVRMFPQELNVLVDVYIYLQMISLVSSLWIVLKSLIYNVTEHSPLYRHFYPHMRTVPFGLFQAHYDLVVLLLFFKHSQPCLLLFFCSSVKNSSSPALLKDFNMFSKWFHQFWLIESTTPQKKRETYHVDSNKVTIRNVCMLLSAINKPMCNKSSRACIVFLSVDQNTPALRS